MTSSNSHFFKNSFIGGLFKSEKKKDRKAGRLSEPFLSFFWLVGHLLIGGMIRKSAAKLSYFFNITKIAFFYLVVNVMRRVM